MRSWASHVSCAHRKDPADETDDRLHGTAVVKGPRAAEEVAAISEVIDAGERAALERPSSSASSSTPLTVDPACFIALFFCQRRAVAPHTIALGHQALALTQRVGLHLTDDRPPDRYRVTTPPG